MQLDISLQTALSNMLQATRHVRMCFDSHILLVHAHGILLIFVCLPGIKKYVVGLIIKTSSDASNVEVSKL